MSNDIWLVRLIPDLEFTCFSYILNIYLRNKLKKQLHKTKYLENFTDSQDLMLANIVRHRGKIKSVAIINAM